MRITVVGVLIVIGTVVLLALIADRVGRERGRNRTFNLLIPNQQPKNQWFQRFPKHFREHK